MKTKLLLLALTVVLPSSCKTLELGPVGKVAYAPVAVAGTAATVVATPVIAFGTGIYAMIEIPREVGLFSDSGPVILFSIGAALGTADCCEFIEDIWAPYKSRAEYEPLPEL